MRTGLSISPSASVRTASAYLGNTFSGPDALFVVSAQHCQRDSDETSEHTAEPDDLSACEHYERKIVALQRKLQGVLSTKQRFRANVRFVTFLVPCMLRTAGVITDASLLAVQMLLNHYKRKARLARQKSHLP